jgi:arginyl-tRNA synthetase
MKAQILQVLGEIFGDTASAPIELSVPETENFGHYSTNFALRVAKDVKRPPMDVANDYAAQIASKAPAGFFQKVEAVAPGFINFWLSEKVIQDELEKVSRAKNFGAGSVGHQKTAIVEYCSPNIAKELHVGHLRNTMIGSALANILEFSGYTVVRWNYLGDWGTQFGKIIAAYKLWGNTETIEKNPVEELQALYVRFHAEAKKDPELEKRGQEEFKKLEAGDPENRKLWEWFKKEALREFEEVYKMLDVHFDVWIGESFFESELKGVVKELVNKGIAERSEGAIVVKLDTEGLPPALIEKSDGASLYLTRDIANLRYRLEKYAPAKILYVVGNEQALAFEQLFAIANKMGMDTAELKHIKYGLVLGASGKKLSTREGTSQSLREVVDEATAKARAIIDEKNPDASPGEKAEIAFAVGMGALKYNDLKENRTTDIIFNWDKMLDFAGDSGPYLQYTYARIQSVLRKAGDVPLANHDMSLLDQPTELALMRKIFEYPDVVEKTAELYSTSILAGYLHKLAVAANKFYETTPILKDGNESRRNARLTLIKTAAHTLQSGLALLGIKTLEKI